MAERLGRAVDPRRGWDYLQRLGRSTSVPRPQHEESDEAEQAAFSYQWMYLYGFVQPESGKASWLLLPTVNTQAFSLALAAL
jgi:hypothetical protein